MKVFRFPYLASPYGERFRMRTFARMFEERRIHVVSRWHDSELVEDPTDPDLNREILNMNNRCIDRSDGVIVFTDVGKPNTTLGEIAWAIRTGKHVHWIMGSNRNGINMFAYHDLVERFEMGGAEYLVRLLNAEGGGADELGKT